MNTLNFRNSFVGQALFVLAALVVSTNMFAQTAVTLQDGTLFTPNPQVIQASQPAPPVVPPTPVSQLTNTTYDYLPSWLLGLMIVGIVAIVITLLLRRRPQPVQVVPVATPPPAPDPVPTEPQQDPQISIPVKFEVKPLVITMEPGEVRLGVLPQQPPIPPAPPPPPPAPPASAPAVSVVAILFALFLFGGLSTQAKAQTPNDIWVHCRVNGNEGMCKFPPAPTPAAAPAPVPAAAPAPVVHHHAAHAAPATLPQLTAAQIRQAVTEGIRAAMPTTPQPVAAPPTSGAAVTATVNTQAITDRFIMYEAEMKRVVARVDDDTKRVNDLTKQVSEVANGEVAVQQRLTTVEGYQADDHETLSVIGAAVVTNSRKNVCDAYQRLKSLNQVSGPGPKGCK